MSNASSAERLTELAAGLATLGKPSLPEPAKTVARQRLLDTLGAALLGLRTGEGRLLLSHARAAPRGVAAPTVWCRLWVGAARTTEVDDIDVASCTTVGSVVVPAALAIAANVPHGERNLLAALTAGYDAMIRLGRAIGGATLLYRGVWPTYVTASFGAAAAASRALDLDETVTARALALAVTRAASVPAAALSQPGGRYYALGCAAADGIDAAFAAAAGVGADLAALASYAHRIGVELEVAELTRSFGAPLLVAAVDTKSWPTSRQALASVAAFQQLARTERSLGEIDKITVSVPAAYRKMVDRAAMPITRIESMIGVQYQLALAALAPERLYDVLRTPPWTHPELADFMRKIEVSADDELSARFPELWGSRVVARWRSGEETTCEVLEPEGSARRPLAWQAFVSKLERIHAASGIEPSGWPRSLAALCERAGTDDTDSLRDLLVFLAGASDGAPALEVRGR